jgi:hypothetical protein
MYIPSYRSFLTPKDYLLSLLSLDNEGMEMFCLCCEVDEILWTDDDDKLCSLSIRIPDQYLTISLRLDWSSGRIHIYFNAYRG